MILALLQTSIPSPLRIMGIRPDLVLVAACCWGAVKGGRSGALWGLLGGLCLDLLASTPLGLHAILLLPSSVLGAVGESFLHQDNLMRPLLGVSVGTFLYYGAFFLALEVMGAKGDWVSLLLDIALPAALLNMGITPLFYWVLSRLVRRGEETITWE